MNASIAMPATGVQFDDDKRKLQARARRLAKRAEVLAGQGRYDEAIAYQSELVDIRPDDVVAVLRLGLLYREVRRLDAAVDQFRRASNLSPSLCDPREALIETLLDACLYDEAVNEGRALLRMSPRNVFARDILSIAYLHLGLSEKALDMATELTRLDPLNASHHFKRALLLQQCGHLGEAVAEYTRARELAMPDSEIHVDAVNALDALDEYQLHQILLLATEDWNFNHQLRLDATEAIQTRGFTLSDDALARAQYLAQDDPQEAVAGQTMLAAWGGVKYYN